MKINAKLLNPCGAAIAILSSTIAMAAAPYGKYEMCHTSPQFFYVDHLGTKSGNATTVAVGRTQASSTWADWIWRGKNEGIVQFCQNNSVNCPFTWGGAHTSSYADSTGTGTGFAGMASAVDVQKLWIKSVTNTKTTIQTWAAGATFAPGYWAEPVIAVARRWKQGDLQGFWMPEQQTRVRPWGCNLDLAWEYKFYPDLRKGSWSKNQAEFTYKIFFVTKDRSKL